MNQKKKKASSIAITFYVFAVLLLIVFAFMTWLTIDTVKETFDQYVTQYGMTSSELWEQMWKSIVTMFVTQSIPYLAYALFCYGFGYVINQLHDMRTENPVTEDHKEVIADPKEEAKQTEEVKQDKEVKAEEKPKKNTKAKQSATKKKEETVKKKETKKNPDEEKKPEDKAAVETKKETATEKPLEEKEPETKE